MSLTSASVWERPLYQAIASYHQLISYPETILAPECFKEAGEKALPQSVLVLAHIASKMVLASSSIKIPRDQTESQLVKTVHALAAYGQRLEHVTSRKILEQMLERPDLDTSFFLTITLPREVFHLLDALVSWRTCNDELQKLNSTENDLHFLTDKITLFETLAAARTEPIMNEDAFAALKETSSEYCSKYLEQLSKCINELGTSVVEDLKGFKTKYGAAYTCADTWEMDTVTHLFESDTNVAEVKAASDAIVSLANICGTMSGIVGHSTVDEGLKAITEKMKLFSADAGKLISECKGVGATVIVSGTILNDPNTKENVLNALALASDYFNVGKDVLPGKLKKLVIDALGPASKPKASARKRKAEEDGGEETKPKKEKTQTQTQSEKAETPKEKDKSSKEKSSKEKSNKQKESSKEKKRKRS